eukprot:1888850-Rhodomonas_salina.1
MQYCTMSAHTHYLSTTSLNALCQYNSTWDTTIMMTLCYASPGQRYTTRDVSTGHRIALYARPVPDIASQGSGPELLGQYRTPHGKYVGYVLGQYRTLHSKCVGYMLGQYRTARRPIASCAMPAPDIA